MKKETLGDGPIVEVYRTKMKAIAETLDEFFNGDVRPKKTGFILLVFPFDAHGGRCNYISNADREDVKVLLREQLARFEGMPEAKGHG